MRDLQAPGSGLCAGQQHRRHSAHQQRHGASQQPGRRTPRAGRRSTAIGAALTSEAPPRPAAPPQPTNGATPEPQAPGAELPIFYSGGRKELGKPRIVILGSGWGAVSLVKALGRRCRDKVDVTLVSPRNYFLYTALLPACATGTVEERSIVEPIRRILGKKGAYFEGNCTDIDPAARVITVCNSKDVGLDDDYFRLPYDLLVLSVGSVNNTFGTPGVEQHTHFFKNIEDAHDLRRRVSHAFERAALPSTSEEERRKLLSFVVVGGGPTGVEVAAELHDMFVDDMRKVYPQLIKDVRIRVVELMDHVLSTYDRAISEYTQKLFARTGIELVLNTKVAAVSRSAVSVVDTRSGERYDIPFGACVWASGIAMHPLVKHLQARLPAGAQTHFRSIVTDATLQVLGSGGSIYAIGDAATIEQEKALAQAEALFEGADTNKDGKLQMAELRALLSKASREYSHFEEHARFLEGKYGPKRWGGMVEGLLAKASPRAAASPAALADLTESAELDRAAFRELLGRIDQGLRALPATAQVAKQQGEYLAGLLGSGQVGPGKPLPPDTAPFRYRHKGSLAYVGGDKAVMDIPQMGPLTGFAAGVAWKGFETYSQVSLRNLLSVAGDWVRTKLFGRDISRV